MISYPLKFNVSSKSESGINQVWQSDSAPQFANQTIPYTSNVAIPAEFEGPGGGYSPEDFYALALMNCFIATFKVIAEKSRLEYKSIESKGSLIVDRGEGGAPWMKSFLAEVTLNGVVDKDRALRLLEKTSQSCMILNSVKTEKTFQFSVL